MKLSPQAKQIFDSINKEDTKLGELRTIAKTIKKDHDLALQLWSTGHFMARQLAVLILDNKQLDQEVIDKLDKDIQTHIPKEQTHLMDWLMANQLTKNKQLIALIESWEHSPSALQRRVFWYYQARLRWMGNTNHTNTEYLLDAIEQRLMTEQPEVQWAMNFTAGQIGKWEEQYRNRCIAIGTSTGLYKDEIVPKNCTPNYLPGFISIEVAKLKNK